MKEINVKINGMTCEHCKSSVENALIELDGVSKAEVDLSKNIASILYDENTLDLEKIKSTVYDIGFDVGD